MNLPPTDIAGSPRIWNARIDMGAYEWNNLGIFEGGSQDDGWRITIRPNPVVNMTTFHYELTGSCQVRLEIFDGYGRKVAEPMNAYQGQWEKEISWDASAFPAGIYYYRLAAGGRFASGKLAVNH